MPGLMHWDPFRAVRRRDELFDDFFREFFSRTDAVGGPAEPAVEVAETDTDVTVKAEMPGVDKDHVSVSVRDDVLTLRGEVREQTEEKRKSYHRRELRYGALERALALPCEVDATKGAAVLKDGVLRVTLPKAAAPTAREVRIVTS